VSGLERWALRDGEKVGTDNIEWIIIVPRVSRAFDILLHPSFNCLAQGRVSRFAEKYILKIDKLHH